MYEDCYDFPSSHAISENCENANNSTVNKLHPFNELPNIEPYAPDCNAFKKHIDKMSKLELSYCLCIKANIFAENVEQKISDKETLNKLYFLVQKLKNKKN